MEAQKKLNIVLVSILTVSSLAAVLCGYFNWQANLSLILGCIISLSVSGIAMLEVYHYQEWFDHNPFCFWFIVAFIAGVMLVLSFWLGNVLPNEFTELLLRSFTFFITPLLGCCIGWCVRKVVDAISDYRWHRLWTRKRI